MEFVIVLAFIFIIAVARWTVTTPADSLGWQFCLINYVVKNMEYVIV